MLTTPPTCSHHNHPSSSPSPTMADKTSSAPSVPSAPPAFFERLNTFSVISRSLGYHPNTRETDANACNKRLKLINFTGVLLVAEANGVIAAITLIRTSTTLEINFSKNRPCITPETTYF